MSWDPLRQHWKGWLVLSLLVLGLGYATKRILGSWGGQGPPAWLQQLSHRSPSLPRPTQQAYQRLLSAAEQAQFSHQTFRFLELAAKPSESILWTTEPISNESFRPLERIATRWHGSRAELLGYYLPDGTPLPYTTQVNPNHQSAFAVLVELRQPLAPGQQSRLLRRQRHPVELQANTNRSYFFRLPAGGPNLLCGVLLGPHAKLVSFKPQRNSLLADATTGLLAWHNPQPAPTIEFAPQ